MSHIQDQLFHTEMLDNLLLFLCQKNTEGHFEELPFFNQILDVKISIHPPICFFEYLLVLLSPLSFVEAAKKVDSEPAMQL